jgi:hypothetical protein
MVGCRIEPRWMIERWMIERWMIERWTPRVSRLGVVGISRELLPHDNAGQITHGSIPRFVAPS